MERIQAITFLIGVRVVRQARPETLVLPIKVVLTAKEEEDGLDSTTGCYQTYKESFEVS